MKNNDDARLLAHKRKVDAERKAKALGKINIQKHNNRLMMAQVASAGKKEDA